MASTKNIKLAFLCLTLLVGVIWLFAGSASQAIATTEAESQLGTAAVADDNYVGSETCAACHEDQFKSFSKTKHGKLGTVASWKNKVQGCESCHGPGKAHVEGSGDKTKIISFRDKNPKEISETCLSCHAGKESHNNFRRGEHWRNNIGCTDCHSAHGVDHESFKPGSITLIGAAARQRPNHADTAMLKQSEPQLCMSCHTETKSQFSKPFHHKVLEGTMNCSDCHNAHGGFDQKQTRLAVGADQSCVKCHSDKQGPFVFEHAPLKIEGCAACHTPHGSANPKMLKRSTVRQLCLECHTDIAGVILDDDFPGGSHNQTAVRSQNCTICHAAIHGSNAQPNFFR
jgi:predicted CXXCH cytochrome family protein